MGLGRNIASLRQGIALLEHIDDELFATSPPGLESGGIGPQFRHIIDYYQCFLRDVATGRIDYDERERRADVETDRAVAKASLVQLVDDLQSAALDDAPDQLLVRVDADPSAALDENLGCSSVSRELQFLLSHTIHHFAIIAVTLSGSGFAPPSGFGVAPSTLRYWGSTADAARR